MERSGAAVLMTILYMYDRASEAHLPRVYRASGAERSILEQQMKKYGDFFFSQGYCSFMFLLARIFSQGYCSSLQRNEYLKIRHYKIQSKSISITIHIISIFSSNTLCLPY